MVLALLLLGVGLTLSFNKFQTEKIQSPFRYPFDVFEDQTDNYSEDISFYEQRIKRDPEGATDLAILAELYLNRGKSSGNQNDFEKAIKLAKNSLKVRKAYNITASIVLADIAQARHKFTDAIQMTKNLLLQKPHDENLLLILTRAQLAIGDLRNALLSVGQLIQISNSATAYGLRALIHEGSGRNQMAQSDFEMAFRHEDPDRKQESIWLRNIFSRFNIFKKNFKLAEFLLKDALRIYPNDAATLGNLGLMAEKQRQFAKAETLLREEIFEKGIGHRSELIELLLDKEQASGYFEALNLAKAELAIRPNAQIYYLLARAYYKNGQQENAKQSLKSALDTGIQSEEMHKLKRLL